MQMKNNITLNHSIFVNMASTANPFASLINNSLTAPMGASGAANPFLKPSVVSDALAASGDVGSDGSDDSDGSWTDEETSFSHLFKPLPTRSRARPISIVKRSLTRKRINNPSSQVGMQCMRGEDGKYYYIPIDPYNPSHLEIIDKLSPLLVNPNPNEFQKGGLYTYIFASIITKNPGTGADIELVPVKLYACRAQNIFEFGTKHHHIFFRMDLIKELASVARANGIDENKVEYGLYASGEIKCITPTKLMVNFFSGTYKMKRKIKIPKFPKHRRGVPYEIDDITKLMRQIDRNYKIKYNPAPFITSESVPITQKHLDFLNSHGIPTFGFDTERQCRDMKIHVMRTKHTDKRTMGFEEMQQKYQQLITPAPPPQESTRLSSFVSAVDSKAASLFPSFAASGFTSAYAMTTDDLRNYAKAHNLPIPDPLDRITKFDLMRTVQEHLTKKKSGGKNRTIKKKRTPKKRTLKQ